MTLTVTLLAIPTVAKIDSSIRKQTLDYKASSIQDNIYMASKLHEGHIELELGDNYVLEFPESDKMVVSYKSATTSRDLINPISAKKLIEAKTICITKSDSDTRVEAGGC